MTNKSIQAGAHLSDKEIAGKIRMLRRDDIDFEAVCVMAKDRILALSQDLETVTKALAEVIPILRSDCELVKIGRLISTQDNRITDQPIFAVQQKRRVWGLDPEEHSFAWVNVDSGAELTEGQHFDDLEAEYDETAEEPGNWRRVGYIDIWEFVTACFTEQGCKDFLALEGHNLKEPRIYAYGSFRNKEYRAVRTWLLARANATELARLELENDRDAARQA